MARLGGLDPERLFAEHAQALYGFISYRVGDPTMAEDILGDTFERLVRSRKDFDERKGSEKTWVYTIALNCLRDHARRLRTERLAHERALPVGEGGDGNLGRVEDRDVLFRALEQLDAGEREILALRYGADLKLADVAAVTELPMTTVNGRLYSGLRKLRAVLQPDRLGSHGGPET